MSSFFIIPILLVVNLYLNFLFVYSFRRFARTNLFLHFNAPSNISLLTRHFPRRSTFSLRYSSETERKMTDNSGLTSPKAVEPRVPTHEGGSELRRRLHDRLARDVGSGRGRGGAGRGGAGGAGAHTQ